MKNINHYMVEDILSKTCYRIYILESPHISEISTSTPASGHSGLVMSKELFNSTTPLGLAIKNGEINEIGIINACQFPLDETVYQTIPTDLFDYMRIKKIQYASNKYKDEIKKEINNIDKLKTVADFRNRIERIVQEKGVKEIVICGFISQAYFEIAYPEIDYVRFKTWCNFSINGSELKFRYTHHPSPKRDGISWTI